MKARSRNNDKTGFTLIELLVAVAIFSTISVLGYRSLQQTIASRDQLIETSKRIAELQHSFAILERDLTTLVARPVRDYLGLAEPAFKHIPAGDEFQVYLTSMAAPGYVDAPVSNLERLQYRWSGKGLQRRRLSTLDSFPGPESRWITLFNETEKMTWQYLDHADRWHAQWPPLNNDQPTEYLLPGAIRITLQSPLHGSIERLIMTGAGR